MFVIAVSEGQLFYWLASNRVRRGRKLQGAWREDLRPAAVDQRTVMVPTVMLLIIVLVSMLMAFQIMLSMIIPTVVESYFSNPERIPQALRRAAGSAVVAVSLVRGSGSAGGGPVGCSRD